MKKLLTVLLLILAQFTYTQTQKVDFESKSITYVTPRKDTINVDFAFVAKKEAETFDKSIALGLVEYANIATQFGLKSSRSYYPLFYYMEYKWKKNGKHKYVVSVKYEATNSYGAVVEGFTPFTFNHKLVETTGSVLLRNSQ